MNLRASRRRIASILLILLASTTAALLSRPGRSEDPAPPPLPAPLFVWANVPPGGAGDGSSWANAFTTLDTAIAAAQPHGSLWVAEGVYQPTFNLSSQTHSFFIDKPLELYGAFAGYEVSISGRQGSAAQTILEGNWGGSLAEHVVVLHEVTGAPGVRIDGFTIQHGSNLNTQLGGGGIFSHCSDLDLVECIVAENTAYFGGGIWFEGGCPGIQGLPNTLHVVSCEFRDNFAERDGGALFGFMLNGDVVSTQFIGNHAKRDGGAVFLWKMGPSQPLAFANDVFWNNHADNTGTTPSLGGAVHLGQSGSGQAAFAYGTFVNCTFSDNYAESCLPGQAVYVSPNSIGEIHNSILAFNESTTCAAIHPIGGSPTVSYTDLWYGPTSVAWIPGIGNIAANPTFRRHAVGTLTLVGLSPCIDAADYTRLPTDAHDFDGDADTAESLPLDLVGENRFFDRQQENNSGYPSTPPPAQDYLDMGAYEKP